MTSLGSQTGKPNSKATEEAFSMSLFADDTTVLGTSEEIEQGTSAIKTVKSRFEEENNDVKRNHSSSETQMPEAYECFEL